MAVQCSAVQETQALIQGGNVEERINPYRLGFNTSIGIRRLVNPGLAHLDLSRLYFCIIYIFTCWLYVCSLTLSVVWLSSDLFVCYAHFC